MKLRKTPEGKTYLHIWREGTAYELANKLRLYEEWNNVRFTLLPVPPDPHITPHDVRRPLPFPDSAFDAVYANHVLEHLTPEEGRPFVAELRRVLRRGGVCRLVVPDLESKCREYLASLEACLAAPSPANVSRYEWSVLLLLDQMVRTESGGRTLRRLRRGEFDPEHLRRHTGDALQRFIGSREEGLLGKIRSRTPVELLFEALRRVRLSLMRGDPRKTREANMWMHDRLSLKRLLEGEGFQDVRPVGFRESAIEGWERYDFDRSEHGDYALEPSAYVEGRRGS